MCWGALLFQLVMTLSVRWHSDNADIASACGSGFDRRPSRLFQFDVRANNRVRERARNT